MGHAKNSLFSDGNCDVSSLYNVCPSLNIKSYQRTSTGAESMVGRSLSTQAPRHRLAGRILWIGTFLITLPGRRFAAMSFSLRKLPPTRRAAFSATNAAAHHNNRGAECSAKYDELMGASKLSLAPMMDYTDRHFRHLVRMISNRTLLYTEMVAASTITYERAGVEQKYRETHPDASDDEVKHGYDDHYLRRCLGQGRIAPEGPSVLQLGGSDPQRMFQAASTVMEMTERGHCDYTALNLNCGCPSPKVAGKGCFGAALMEDPALVAELTKALHDGSDGKLPVTVKCRIGTDTDQPFTKQGYASIDSEAEYRKLCDFIETVASNGIVTDFSVHARIAVLKKSFSPSDNRKIPPLKYEFVHRLAEDYPELTFTLNGGIDSLSQALQRFDEYPNLCGVMIGRGWAADPWSFAMADKLLYNDSTYSPQNRLEILRRFGEHADEEERTGDPIKIRRFIIKAVTPLFAGEHNGKKFRIALDEIAGRPKKLKAQGKSLDSEPAISQLILNAAIENLSEEVLLRSPEESYERSLLAEAQRRGARLTNVAEWQERRKEEEATSAYAQSLANPQ